MTESKHTPGEWLADEEHGMIFSRPKPLVKFVIATTESGTFDEQCANARLIADDPDLLAMLKHAVHWHDQLTPNDIARYEAVIASAEARS